MMPKSVLWLDGNDLDDALVQGCHVAPQTWRFIGIYRQAGQGYAYTQTQAQSPGSTASQAYQEALQAGADAATRYFASLYGPITEEIDDE